MKDAGYTLDETALASGTSCTTLWRRLKEFNLCVSKYSDISNFALDFIVQKYREKLKLWSGHASRIFVKHRCECAALENS